MLINVLMFSFFIVRCVHLSVILYHHNISRIFPCHPTSSLLSLPRFTEPGTPVNTRIFFVFIIDSIFNLKIPSIKKAAWINNYIKRFSAKVIFLTIWIIILNNALQCAREMWGLYDYMCGWVTKTWVSVCVWFFPSSRHVRFTINRTILMEALWIIWLGILTGRGHIWLGNSCAFFLSIARY